MNRSNDANIDKIKALAKKRGLKIKFICSELGLAETYLSNVKNGKDRMTDERLYTIANILGTTYEYLTDQTDDSAPKNESTKKDMDKTEKTPNIKSNASIIEDDNSVYMIPVFESVSAGFGTYADDYITEYIPMYFSNPHEANESIFVTVRGDSMYPKIEDGDVVLVHKQTSVDSGTIAVVLLDGEEALVKKIVYGDVWIELHSVNPMYPVMRFEGEDVLRLQVLGQVKKIIKNV